MDETTLRTVLLTLFDLARADRPATLHRAAARAGLTPARTLAALAALGRAGLCDPVRVRLTMRGLVVAARLSTGRPIDARALAA